MEHDLEDSLWEGLERLIQIYRSENLVWYSDLKMCPCYFLDRLLAFAMLNETEDIRGCNVDDGSRMTAGFYSFTTG